MAEGESKGWWGTFELAEEAAARWRIGPLEFVVLRREEEWQVGHTRSDDPLRESEGWEVEIGAPAPETLDNLERFVFARTRGPLEVLPIMADRPVVSSPRVPFHLPSGEQTTLYVGSPLWVGLRVGSPPVSLKQIAIRRPTDTWFGPSTREGELCYGTRTHAILDTANLPKLARRAVTAVVIRNEAPETLLLDRLKLPVPLLSVYGDKDGRLWTEQVTLVRSESGEMAAVEVGSGPPQEAGELERLAGPRKSSERGLLLMRAFADLFGD